MASSMSSALNWYKTRNVVNMFFETYPPEQLDELLATNKVLCEVRKQDRAKYEPDSLSNVVRCISASTKSPTMLSTPKQKKANNPDEEEHCAKVFVILQAPIQVFSNCVFNTKNLAEKPRLTLTWNSSPNDFFLFFVPQFIKY